MPVITRFKKRHFGKVSYLRFLKQTLLDYPTVDNGGFSRECLGMLGDAGGSLGMLGGPWGLWGIIGDPGGSLNILGDPERCCHNYSFISFCIGSSICIGWESFCLPYGRFFSSKLNICFHLSKNNIKASCWVNATSQQKNHATFKKKKFQYF